MACEECDLESRTEFLLIESSGGGIRTPDTRIMIPRACERNCNKHSDLPQTAKGCCTNGCTRNCQQLSRLVANWQELSLELRFAISAMIAAVIERDAETTFRKS